MLSPPGPRTVNKGNHNRCALVPLLLVPLVAPAARLGAGEAAVLPWAAGPATGARLRAAEAEPTGVWEDPSTWCGVGYVYNKKLAL